MDVKRELLARLALFEAVAVDEIMPRLHSVPLEQKMVGGTFKENVTEADRAASRRILAELRTALPGSYSEEELYDDRFDYPFVWQVDPLDGTDEFCAGLTDFFAVQGAILERTAGGYEARGGIIHLPGRRETYFSDGTDAFVKRFGGETVRLERPKLGRALRCYYRAIDGMQGPEGDEFYARLGKALNLPIEKVEIGGAGSAFAALVRGELDIVILNIDYSKEWDASMAEPFVKAFGGWIRDVDGNPLVYNKRESVFNERGVFASINLDQDLVKKCLFDGVLRRGR